MTCRLDPLHPKSPPHSREAMLLSSWTLIETADSSRGCKASIFFSVALCLFAFQTLYPAGSLAAFDERGGAFDFMFPDVPFYD